MVARFKDDSFQPPNWAQDGVIPRQPDLLKDFEPSLPDWPPKMSPGYQPSEPVPGYPWWVDPHGFPTLPRRVPGPSDFPLPTTLQGPSPSIDPSQNWLSSYYAQMLSQHDAPQPAGGLDRTKKDDPLLERKLERSTYRA